MTPFDDGGIDLAVSLTLSDGEVQLLDFLGQLIFQHKGQGTTNALAVARWQMGAG